MTTSHSLPGLETVRRNYPLMLMRMERLMELSRNLASTLDLSRLLREIIQAGRELTETEACSIMLADPQSGELRFEATTNLEASALEGVIVPIDGSIAGTIYKTAQPIVVPDVSQDARWNRNVDSRMAFVTRSILGVPLTTREKTIGVLQAVNKVKGRFNDEDLTILQALAAQAAVAVVNARLFQQSDFIAELAHELRTPLSSITSASALLMRPDLPEDRRVFVAQTIKREAERLNHMVTEVLDMARLESGRMRFVRETFDIVELINECAEVIRPQTVERGLKLVVDVAGAPITITSDRGKIKQVILNLLTNAVKYNRPQGGVRLQAAAEGAFCRIAVSDTGRGIPPEAMAHMFEKFYRVPNTETTTSGTGLGLPIARKIVESLGGEMRVESRLNYGSTFSFTLPI